MERQGLVDTDCCVILVGCQTSTPDIPESGSVIDPCADRLHDISGHLLLNYSLNQRLLQTLDDLRAASGQAEAPPLVCPVSGKPYIYRPEGLQVSGQVGRLVLYVCTSWRQARKCKLEPIAPQQVPGLIIWWRIGDSNP